MSFCSPEAKSSKANTQKNKKTAILTQRPAQRPLGEYVRSRVDVTPLLLIFVGQRATTFLKLMVVDKVRDHQCAIRRNHLFRRIPVAIFLLKDYIGGKSSVSPISENRIVVCVIIECIVLKVFRNKVRAVRSESDRCTDIT